jgi:hypothetical protein
MNTLQKQLEAKILAELDVMLCRLRILELEMQQAAANRARETGGNRR